MNAEKRALSFVCQGAALVGIADIPERPLERGVLIVTGGPQYRAGSHRQLTLLARVLAARGLPTLRFDRRGMGDSDGQPRSFEAIDEDIRAALKEFFTQLPNMKEVVLWGLSDGATAAALYAHTDHRVCGLVLLNPWLRASRTAARVLLRRYYLRRLGELAFWKRVASGNFNLAASVQALRHNMRLLARERRTMLAQRVRQSLALFHGPVQVILSGADPNAREFDHLLTRHNLRCQRVDVVGANATFASRFWRDQVAEQCANWIASW
jgi:exosortase A-associated hydrolase 1